MSDMMAFPDTVEEFMENYKIVDTDEVYTNGAELVPIFRMKQWFEHLPSAQPERKTGRWIHDGYAFRGGIDWMHCSECGHKDSWSAATRTPFCAWCGARMEGEG